MLLNYKQAMGGAPRGAGRDVQTAIRLSFFEAAHGCTKDVQFEYFVRDPASANSANKRAPPKKIRKTRNVKLDIPPGEYLVHFLRAYICACSTVVWALLCLYCRCSLEKLRRYSSRMRTPY